MRWQKQIAGASALIVTGGGTLYSVWQTAAMDPPPVPISAIWLLGGAVTTAATLGAYFVTPGGTPAHATQPSIAERQRRIVDHSVNELLAATIPNLSQCPDQTGAIVYFPDGAGVLSPTFSFNKGRPRQAQLRFEKWQGCTGHAWGAARQMVADLSQTTPADLELTWKLPAEFVEATKDLKVVVSTPIWASDGSQKVVGVVSVDCTETLAECGLGTQNSLAAARVMALSIGQILRLAGVEPRSLA